MANTMPFFHLNDDNKGNAFCGYFSIEFNKNSQLIRGASVVVLKRISGKRYGRVLIDYH